MNRTTIGLAVLVGWMGALGCAEAGNTCTWTGSWNTLPNNTDDVIVVSSGGNMTWSNTFPQTVASWTQEATYSATTTFTTVYGTNGLTNFTITGHAIIAGGAWVHTANSTADVNRLCVTVNGNLTLDNAASIHGNMRGRGNLNGPGAASSIVDGPAHGGTGSKGDGTRNTNVYGSITEPTALGSGGGAADAYGGGAILLTVDGTTSIAPDASISVGGGNSITRAGGTGGSIWLTTGELTGSGKIQANGGTGASIVGGSGGSGGRVAIVLTAQDADFSNWTGMNTALGAGANISAAGTVYRRIQAGADELIIDNNSRDANIQYDTLMPDATDLDGFSNIIVRGKGNLGIRGDTTIDFGTVNLTLDGSAASTITINGDSNVTYPTDWMITNYTLNPLSVTSNKITNLTVGTSGVIKHGANTTSELYKVSLSIAGNLNILSGGTINAGSCGFGFRTGPGAASQDVGGAAHGGGTWDGTAGVFNFKTYGSILEPAQLGSGGSTSGGDTGSPRGGGRILLTVIGTTTISSGGTISANGGSTTTRGGASGGSIRLTTGRLEGSGTIRANGGSGSSIVSGAGGAGGRVAIILTATDANFSNWTGTNTAYGAGPVVSGAGTVFRREAGLAAGAGTVLVNNGALTVNTNTYVTIPAFAASTEDLTKTRWEATGKTHIGLVANAAIQSLDMGTDTSLELNSFTLTVEELTVNGTVYENGIYTPVQISRLKDRVGGGSLVVFLAPKGTVISFH